MEILQKIGLGIEFKINGLNVQVLTRGIWEDDEFQEERSGALTIEQQQVLDSLEDEI